MKRVQRNITPPISTLPPPDYGHSGPKSSPARRQRSLQKALFHAAAPPLIFAILVAGILVEVRARLAPPPPPPPPPGIGATLTVHGNTIAQRARWRVGRACGRSL